MFFCTIFATNYTLRKNKKKNQLLNKIPLNLYSIYISKQNMRKKIIVYMDRAFLKIRMKYKAASIHKKGCLFLIEESLIF